MASSCVPSVFSFLGCLQTALDSAGYGNIYLKIKQAVCLERLFLNKDILAVLPTGYGKSLIYQVLPSLLKEMDMKTAKSASAVILVSPLNALLHEQVSKLKENGIKAAVLSVKERTDGTVTDDEGERTPIILPYWEGDHQTIVEAGYDILFCHPEAFISCRQGLNVFQSKTYRSAVKAVVVDEAHCILEWGIDFRPDYGKLGVLAALFPDAPITALTATATKHDREVIATTLSLQNVKQIIGNIDRPNIFYKKISVRKGSDSEAYTNILEPIAEGLLKEGINYPLTFIYMSLQLCGKAYKLFKSILKEKQYHTSDSLPIPENRLFGQFHAPQTDQMKESILKELSSSNSKCRVVFATMAMGMGVNIPSVRHVIHICPPGSVREYYQDSGRAGRDGLQSWATLYYNNRNIASNRQGITDNIRSYCKSIDQCLRKQLNYLDAPFTTAVCMSHFCCDVCIKCINVAVKNARRANVILSQLTIVQALFPWLQLQSMTQCLRPS